MPHAGGHQWAHVLEHKESQLKPSSGSTKVYPEVQILSGGDNHTTLAERHPCKNGAEDTWDMSGGTSEMNTEDKEVQHEVSWGSTHNMKSPYRNTTERVCCGDMEGHLKMTLCR